MGESSSRKRRDGRERLGGRSSSADSGAPALYMLLDEGAGCSEGRTEAEPAVPGLVSERDEGIGRTAWSCWLSAMLTRSSLPEFSRM
jgi:hypothetical protein